MKKKKEKKKERKKTKICLKGLEENRKPIS